MTLPEVTQNEKNIFSERNYFSGMLDTSLDSLSGWEKRKSETFSSFRHLRRALEVGLTNLADPEKELFQNLFDLFELKHGIGENNKIMIDLLSKDKEGKSVGFLGPLGVGKTTIANASIKDLSAKSVTHEPYDKNVFWRLSQENSDFMLRSQVYFFLSNIFSDIKTSLHPGTSISDTSTLTDVLMWADWYNKTGNFDDGDYAVYQKMVELFKPLIPKPDLLVMLVPSSIEELKEGIRRRGRPSEQRFAKEESRDLAIQTERVKELSKIIVSEWNIPVLNITLSPLQVYNDPPLPYDYIYQIRDRLGLLGELLKPQPEKVADRIIKLLTPPNIPGQVAVIHAKSMFAGKTTALCLIAELLGKEKSLVFQPKRAIRSVETAFTNQEASVISRDGLSIPATTINDDSLLSIVRLVKEQKVNPKDHPYILIDEVMLFVAEAGKPEKATEALETLRQMGFHVIVDGIDLTFQEEPFTFMPSLLYQTTGNKNWHQIEMSTRCRYCDERAEGTRRWIINPDGTKGIARRSDKFDIPGSNMYEPVCCKKHKSCVD